ncbi:MAG: HNH endonuclease [Streptomyces sp.]|nr:HNH endonuclease [Streptomyces sp.]
MSGSRRYTVDVLRAAAAQCHDIDEVIAFLGTPPYGKLGRYLMRRFAHHGIDVSHFRPADRRSAPGAAQVREAVAASVSIAGTLRHLGLPDDSRGRRQLRAWMADAGADSSHFLGQGHGRGRAGPAPARPAAAVLVKRTDGGRTRTDVLRRCMMQMGVPEVCALCGTGPVWRGRPMTLEVDHVNGDRGDDRLPNLRLLCPNCHAVTGTWCRGARRRAGGRRGGQERTGRMAGPTGGGGATATQQT